VSSTAPAVRLAVDAATFSEEVLQRSHEVPVVVDFWASWCGPCRQLGPILEAAVDEMGGAVLLRTLDVDSNPELAQRYQVRGIPAVKAFRGGEVVAEFVGAQPSSAVKSFLGGLTPSPADQLVELGDEDSLREALRLDPSHLPARRALTRALIRKGYCAEAVEAAGQAPQDRICAGLSAWAELCQDDDRDPADAPLLAALSSDQFDRAVELSISLIPSHQGEQRDRLRRIILYCFEQLGPDHPTVVEGRSRLAAALY
jgi:putative thioredoxin